MDLLVSSTPSAGDTAATVTILVEGLRAPTAEDGAAMWRLAVAGGLDVNSPYKYLVFCRDFADTSAVAWDGRTLAGFVTGYRRPTALETLFVWQIAVDPRYRGSGLGQMMLTHIWERDRTPPVRLLEASVTPSNTASQNLFRSFAKGIEASCSESVLFPASAFPTPHEPELLVRIGFDDSDNSDDSDNRKDSA